jgi:hypothetical protein
VAKRLDKESIILDPYHKNLNNVQRKSHKSVSSRVTYLDRAVTTDDSFLSVDEARNIFISNRNVTKDTKENLDAYNIEKF